MAEIIVLANEKGGVGKTTTTAHFGVEVSRKFNARVLLVDLDPQGNLTKTLVGDLAAGAQTIYHVLAGVASLADIAFRIEETEQGGVVDILPANRGLSGLEKALSNDMNQHFKLREVLKPVADLYDYILIDCQASQGLGTVNAFCAADKLLIPVQCEFYAMEGVAMFAQSIEEVRKFLNPSLVVCGVLPVRFKKNYRINRDVVDKLTELSGELVFSTPIRDTTKLSESPSYQQTVFDYAPRTAGADDYKDAAEEFVARCSNGNNFEELTQNFLTNCEEERTERGM